MSFFWLSRSFLIALLCLSFVLSPALADAEESISVSVLQEVLTDYQMKLVSAHADLVKAQSALAAAEENLAGAPERRRVERQAGIEFTVAGVAGMVIGYKLMRARGPNVGI